MQTLDSSVYINNAQVATRPMVPNTIGTIKSVVTHDKTQSPVYEVEVLFHNSPTLIICKPLYQFSSPLNHQEFWLQTHNESESSSSKPMASHSFNFRIGDTVFVSFIESDIASGGVILGCLPHAGKKLKISKDIQYYEIFSGVEQTINKDGEFTLTRKGIPTNLSELQSHTKTENPPDPNYSAEDTGSFLTFKKDGSFEVNDTKTQSILIDRTIKKIQLKSNDCLFELGVTAEPLTGGYLKVPNTLSLNASSTGFQMGKLTKAGPESIYAMAPNILNLNASTTKIMMGKVTPAGPESIFIQATSMCMIGAAACNVVATASCTIAAPVITLAAAGGVVIAGAGISSSATGSSEMKASSMSQTCSSSFKVNSPKIHLGNDGIELVAGLIELIEGLGTVTPIVGGAVGNPLSSAPTWAIIEALKLRIKTLKS